MPASLPPKDLPIFPLIGSLLLPGMHLPLHVFEPRYRSMVRDALKGAKCLGIIQPCVGEPEASQAALGDPTVVGAPQPQPPLYRIGCAGRITRSERTPDGRYLIIVRGVCRFRIAGELPLHKGYRRLEADYTAYAEDLHDVQLQLDTDSLLRTLDIYTARRSMRLEPGALDELSPLALINGLCMSLPLHPAEKQALLESSISQRAEYLETLLRMETVEAERRKPQVLLN